MFERFTDKARRVVVLAQEEAVMLNHDYIGTEHILLGLIRDDDEIAARSLESLGVHLEAVRREIEAIIGQGRAAPSGQIPFTPRAKKVLELSLREALQLGHDYIGTEHILLGLLREGEGVAAQVLQKLGAELTKVRAEVLRPLTGSSEIDEATWAEVRGDPPLCPRCRASLSETAVHRMIEVASHEQGGQARAVSFAYCRRCGIWLGTLG